MILVIIYVIRADAGTSGSVTVGVEPDTRSYKLSWVINV